MVAFNNQGNTHLAQGRLDQARNVYEQALAIAERLATAEVTNTDWHRELSISYIKFGEVAEAAGRLTGLKTNP